MKRFLIYGSLTLLLVTFLAGSFTLKWLLESPDGIRWLLRTVSLHTPVTITVRTVSGGLDSSLRLQGLSARWPTGELNVSKLHMRCQPLLLTFGTLALPELSLQGVRYRDLSPPESNGAEFIWPRMAGFPAWLNARVDHLTVDDFSYSGSNQPTLIIPALSATLTLNGSRTIISDLAMVTGYGKVAGSLTAGFDKPSLVSSLTVEPVQPVAGVSRFELRTRLNSGTSPEQISGDITLSARAGKAARYTLTGRVGLTGNELNLHGVTLTEAGRRGSIRATGALLLTGDVRLRLTPDRLDLLPELGEKITLNGTIDLNGNSSIYSGSLNLSTNGAGWRKVATIGQFTGNQNTITLTGLNATALSGTVRGNLLLDWRNDLSVKGKLQGQGLDPARLDPSWKGVVNFDLDSSTSWAGGVLRKGELHGRLRNSRLRGKTLSGEVSATVDHHDLSISQLFLTGDGFNIHANGILSQRLEMSARISDLSGLIPHTSGAVDLMGWGRYAGGTVSGDVSGNGRNLAAEGVLITSATLNAHLADGKNRTVQAAAQLSGVTYQGISVDSAALKVAGSIAQHRADLALRSDGAEVAGVVTGGCGDGSWRGELTSLTGRDRIGPWRLEAPAALTITDQTVSLTSLVLTGLPSERAQLSGRLQLQPLQGSAQASWSGIELARANQWLNDTRLQGGSSGDMKLGLPVGGRLILAGSASATGTVTQGKQSITIRKARLELDAGDRGTTATLEVQTDEGIFATGRFSSTDPATLSVPSHGLLNASWEGLDVALAKRWLPPELYLKGRLSGTIGGKLLPDERFALDGTIALADGGGRWRDDQRELAAAVRTSGLTWNWSGESLSGSFSLALAQRGDATGTFRVPLPARLGALPDSAGEVRGTLRGRFQEMGILPSMFPGLVQETNGLLEVNLSAGGTLQTPVVTGTATLSEAGAYLPAAGIRLADARMDARLEGNQIIIKSFRVNSGTGQIEGSAELDFAGSSLTAYRGVLRGERFQAVYLPELQLVLAPDLTFEGNLDKISARGTIKVPEMQVHSLATSTAIKPSRDVVLIDKQRPATITAGPALDLQLRILLGDKVVVKTEGLDARLEGGINIRMTNPAAVTGHGEITVTKGNYRIYGVTLDIKRGRAIFTGGAVERPALDILALREIEEVKAGVTITGTPETPVIKLYSEPALPDTDILSYIVFGHKMGESGQDTALLMQAASLVTSSQETTGIQEQIKQLVNLDTLTFDSGKDRSSGYKAIETNRNGSRNSSTNGKGNAGTSQTMLQLGKYLTPKLYVSFGRSLFEQSQQLRARYSFTKQWEVESKVSSESTGGDIHYRIEFD